MTETPNVPVAARPAASLILLRESTSGPQILMGTRGAGHKFMPNRLVFPGGAVDPGDHNAACATMLPAHSTFRLGGVDAGSLPMALAIAAARETEEETGLSLGQPPRLDGLDYLCRAVTPATSPVRFDARFFVVDASLASGSLSGSGELEGLRFYDMAEAMALDLALATRFVFERLQAWRAQTPEQRAAQTQVAVLRNRVWALE